jgi:hypothetical protein
MKDPAPLEVAPFNNSGRGEACSSSATRVSPPTATLDLTAQQRFLDFMSWQKEFLQEFK